MKDVDVGVYGDFIKRLVSYGFTVITPTRVGYGRERADLMLDSTVTTTNPCLNFRASDVLADEGAAVLEFVRTLPYIDQENGIAAGQSYGGAMAIAMAGHGLHGIKAVLNVSGGMLARRGQEIQCANETSDVFVHYSTSNQIPELWLYAEDDSVVPFEIAKKWFDKVESAGGNVKFISFSSGGHNIEQTKPRETAEAFKKFAQIVGVIK